ncbi:hypothetical protein [Chloracidobacterium aggregatum]|uniref:hypothetical protein n=1 Tax=Chloracidobacterium aggregatum TaxID=2851959 RepID=UPI001B8CE04F|nr:hypothetical protein [Chloracidobacterium aggregatum]QUV86258.1 hypothetical protein J8C03_15915 [Chloracidobacterium sp. 2]
MRANVGPNFGPTQPDGNNILMPTTSRPVVRDTNHDGVFDERDRNRNSFEGQTMYFHRGGTTNTYSAGCQTMPQSEFNRFWDSLATSSGSSTFWSRLARNNRIALAVQERTDIYERTNWWHCARRSHAGHFQPSPRSTVTRDWRQIL